MTDWDLLAELAAPFPDKLQHDAPYGKYGRYIKHSDVTQRMLSIVGLHNFSIISEVRGYAPEHATSSGTVHPAREGAIVGAIGEMVITDDDGQRHTVREVGTVDIPAMDHDAENLKKAASDAYKRCAMRFGLGLHMWSPDSYYLAAQLTKDTGPAGAKGATS